MADGKAEDVVEQIEAQFDPEAVADLEAEVAIVIEPHVDPEINADLEV